VREVNRDIDANLQSVVEFSPERMALAGPLG
jgi:hypothetical protein